MTEESILRARQNCCRLCLAPDSECISIFNSYAADKEPLATKIQSCVNIKVTPIDKLSLRICHACISYLNSWQSFKNRCVASQNKQRSWLEISMRMEKKHVGTGVSLTTLPSGDGGGGNRDADEHGNSELASSILEGISSLKKRRSLTVYPIPVHIKDEPMEDEEYDPKLEESDIDPTLFLERNEEDGSDNLSQKEQHLASLGLKQATGSAHPLTYLTDYNFEGDKNSLPSTDRSLEITTTTTEVKEASCRSCNLKFSTRANARRHERNLHPHLFTSITTSAKGLNIVSPMQHAIKNTNILGQVRPTIKPEQIVLFDYDQPEKYQHLLTEDKILFMQQNEDFLQQYQNMTCNCCLRTHSTYKNFMAHMRKKYHSLPRNLCFKCLKQNDSKALFISHLKKRNCINLYKIYHGLIDAGVLKKDAISCSPDKLRAKELLVNKIYECKICSKHFRLKLEFRSHVYEEHGDSQKKDVSPGHCGFCGLEIEDPFERKRHYNNMDCIVILRCITCEEKFDNHQKFLDHVYSRHLINNNEAQKSSLMKELSSTTSTDSSPSKKSETPSKPQFFSRLPQSCNICGQHYNNYNNVLRHMESKHPDQLPQTYKCTRCLVGYPRLMNLREHMIEVHGMKVDKVRNNSFDYIVDSPTVQGGMSRTTDKMGSDAYTGRYDYVMKDLLSITNGGTVNMENTNDIDDDGNQSDTQPPKKIKLESGLVVAVGTASLKECPICSAVFNNNIGLSNHMRTHANGGEPGDDDIVEDEDDTTEKKPIDPLFKRSLELAADRRFRRMRCRICQKRFSSKKSYRRHMLIDHQIRNVQFIKCKLCNAEFAYEKGLKVHMFKIHNTLLKDEMIVKQYECDICSIVYRTEEQLLQHKKSVHGTENAQAEDELPPSLDQSMEASAPLYWYQCRYCPSNFNTNKKLAIHINSHYEFDSNDYSCKDCGNVYSGRKSLWVHRYKKHPPVADPSECKLCKKMFFDKQMLENHSQSCVQKRVVPLAVPETESAPFFQHKTADDEDASQSQHQQEPVANENSTANLKIKLPEVACTICAQKFTDQDLFTKHIQMHEMELYTDNPLASMFDTGPADPNQFYLDRVNDNGEYVCDICTKPFAQMTALKVHRKWHFRGDSKQAPPVDTNAPKTLKRKRELKCDYCPSTFISSNNLRRHIAELHKSEVSNWPEPPKIEPEKYLQCAKCDLKFDSKKDWIEHKVNEAKIAKPFGPFQWGCEICGMYLSRREKLIHHMMAHIKETNGQVNVEAENYPGESNSQDSELSGHQEQSEHQQIDEEDDEEEEEEEEFDVDEDDIDDTANTVNLDDNANDGQNDDDDGELQSEMNQRLQHESNDESNDSSDQSSDSDDSSSSEDEPDGGSLEHNEPKKRYACDLCQVYFETSTELQKHVTSHFLNGPGSVTLTTITKDKSKLSEIKTKNISDIDDDDDDDDDMNEADAVDS